MIALLYYFGIIVILIVTSLYIYFKTSYNHWKHRNIPFEEPIVPFGTVIEMVKKKLSMGEYFKNAYTNAKQAGHRHIGLYILNLPVYMPIDLQLVKNILSTDFNHFVDRGVYYNEKDDPLSLHLVTAEGLSWRNLRAKLTPTFTSAKMKMMFVTLMEIGNNLESALETFTDEPVDIKDYMSRFTTDIIGSVAFGLDCNSFSDPNSEFKKYGQKFFSSSKLQGLYGFFTGSFPDLARTLRMTSLPTDVSEFFMGVIKETVRYREKHNVRRADFLQLLIDLRDTSQNDGTMDFTKIEQIAAQSFLFFIAGLETSSSTLSYCMYELAVNPDIQERFRRELSFVLEQHQGQITYDALTELKYMDQVIDETLRKYPPLPYLNRSCTSAYNIPGTNTKLDKGTLIFISPFGLHRDPEFFPEPDKFDPERFSEQNKGKIAPFTYLPFGSGPRSCLGLRFGMMEVKIGLSIMLKNFEFSLNKRTQLPLKIDSYNVMLSTNGSIWLDVNKL